MPFARGAGVHVRSLGKGTVREVRNGKRYVVEIKGRSLLVDERDLTPLEGDKRRATRCAPSEPLAGAPPSRNGIPATIDLHGMTAERAASAVTAFISDAILAGHPEVRVIHGRSGGTLKVTVHSHLRSIPSVRAFRVDPVNPGVTIVSL